MMVMMAMHYYYDLGAFRDQQRLGRDAVALQVAVICNEPGLAPASPCTEDVETILLVIKDLLIEFVALKIFLLLIPEL